MMENARDVFKSIQFGITAEDEYLEFKQVLPSVKARDAALETAKDFAQFANRWGGHIFYGIVEEEKDGHNVATEIKGVAELETFKRFVNDKVIPYFHPNELSYTLAVINRGADTVLCAEIQPSPNLIMLHREGATPGVIVVERTPFGKRYLSPEKICKRITDMSRAHKIILKELEQLKEIEIVSPVMSLGAAWTPIGPKNYRAFVDNLGRDEFRIGINSRMIRIPYSLIRHVWKTEFNKIGLVVDAEIRINERSDSLELRIA